MVTGNRQGLVQVYTGNGKGKTTAAWGQALRAIGHNQRVAVVRFLKSDGSGELQAAKLFSPDLQVFGHTSPYDPRVDQRESVQLRRDSRANFELALQVLTSEQWDMVVLDEINMVLHYGFVSESEMMNLLEQRPQRVELILTGRHAPAWLIEKADLVTEMLEIKHPAERDIGPRIGVEY